MKEQVRWLNIEAFRDPKYRQVYWIHDPKIGEAILQRYTENGKPYGLEFGFGSQPTRVHLISDKIDWILTEKSPEAVLGAMMNFPLRWDDVDPLDLPKRQKIFAIAKAADKDAVSNANVLVYRNPDYTSIGSLFPHYDELRLGQRIVLIINQMNIVEMPCYKGLLSSRGYDPLKLLPRSSTLPLLSFRWPLEKSAGFVFDLVK